MALAEQGEGKRNETKRHVFLATYLYLLRTFDGVYFLLRRGLGVGMDIGI